MFSSSESLGPSNLDIVGENVRILSDTLFQLMFLRAIQTPLGSLLDFSDVSTFFVEVANVSRIAGSPAKLSKNLLTILCSSCGIVMSCLRQVGRSRSFHFLAENTSSSAGIACMCSNIQIRATRLSARPWTCSTPQQLTAAQSLTLRT